MPENGYQVNFNDVNRLKVIVYDAEAVPRFIWAGLQEADQAQYETNIATAVGGEVAERPDPIASSVEAYADIRVHPELLVGKEGGYNDHQIFRRVLVSAVVEKGNMKVVGGVITEDNSSAMSSTPDILKPLEYHVKMFMPPAIKFPLIGRKRHVHFREAFALPDFQNPIDVDEDQLVLSGIPLLALNASLRYRKSQQNLVGYRDPHDPADKSFVDLTTLLDMEEAPYNPNRPTKLIRVQKSVGEVQSGILSINGAANAIVRLEVSRKTNRQEEARKKEEDERKRIAAENRLMLDNQATRGNN